MTGREIVEAVKAKYKEGLLSVEEIAEMSGVHKDTIVNWFYRGTNPRIDSLVLVADALGLRIDARPRGYKLAECAKCKGKGPTGMWACIGSTAARCSVCGMIVERADALRYAMRYCPWCGTKMENGGRTK